MVPPKIKNVASKEKTAKKFKKKIRQVVLGTVCDRLAEITKKGRKPYGEVSKIVKDMKSDYPWLNRHVVDYAFQMHQKKVDNSESNSNAVEDNVLSLSGSDTNSGSASRKKGGRPSGTTDDEKVKKDETIRLAQDSMAIEYDHKRKESKRFGRKLENGFLEKLVKKWKIKYRLDDSVKINKATIRSRSYNQRLIVTSMGPRSPMADVEPVLVDLIIKMSRIRRCLTPTQCLHLANDLVKGTETEKEVIKFKEKQYHRRYTSASLGPSYWNGFKSRWGNRICSKRGQKFALDRSSATTFTNISKMYDEVYEALVECGVASQLNTPVYMDREGNSVIGNTDAFGVKCTHVLDNPDMCLVVDEVGSNLSQKGDGHVGGQKYICEKGAIPQIKVQHTEKHFTLLGFTALDGQPVLCVIIISGVREHLNVESGIDPTKEVEGDLNDEDFVEQNFGPGKLFPGGPTCNFRGQDIPCMVRWSPKGGITSQILADALAHIDAYNTFPRTNGKYPFLLLDGHSSRFELPFLEYVTMKTTNGWFVSAFLTELPYGKLVTVMNRTVRTK